MDKKLSIAIACGGTGGHLYPGLAVGEALRDRGCDVVLWLTGRATEAAGKAEWGGPVVEIPSRGVCTGGPVRRFAGLLRMLPAIRRAWRAMRVSPPDALLATGSYACIAPALAAWLLRVPVLLHEANVVPGTAIRVLRRFAAFTGAAFPETAARLKPTQVAIVGMPLRAVLARRAAAPRARHEGFRVLVVGGSGGAHRLNELAVDALSRFAKTCHALRVTHLAGTADEAWVREAYGKAGVRAEVLAYGRDMASLYATSDFVLARAGASTCAELSLFGLPALLVPYPHAGGHQACNARSLESRGAADCLEEAGLDGERLAAYFARNHASPGHWRSLAGTIAVRGVPDGTAAMADQVYRAALLHAKKAAAK
ncbi:MAG: UDP-N-acetylglucosamine--N-acetylmuramyl-(pentapeptide) pyrophosphoryl-undecaprenol N-acetylglucosamine transferase [Kiritimatiellae bacterium]|nr:UDP-N-acetylglucosamine--N-acetylmuramyl-(pentapeptide) pyrophosphoryl-undecaprenol N-acetylglucosamine transferase [Kiritimatiellia bacterium]